MEDGEILLVDDEEAILKALRRTLNFHGYSPLVTTNPKKALEIIKDRNIGILICDQRMPEMLGNEVLLHAKKKFPSIVRILITGFSDMQCTIAAINDGEIFRYITKPWKDDDVIHVIKDAFEYRRDSLKKEYIINHVLSEKEEWKRTTERLSLSLDHSMKGAINALIKIVKVKDVELYQHSERVESYALQLANQIGLPEERKINLSHASLFHDIGKIAIRDKVLYKNGPLDDSDFGSMKQHPVFSMEIIKALGFLDDVADIILQHHEKLDGNGYPNGLKAKDIKLEAKILTIADVYDALTSDRVYHKGITHHEAMDIMLKGIGTHFDQDILNIIQRGCLTNNAL